MAKKKTIAPVYWKKHKTKIWNAQIKKIEKKQREYDEKSAQLLKRKGTSRDSWDTYQKKQQDRELARLFQNARSASTLMRKDGNRIELMLTLTISQPYRVADTDKSFDEVMQRIKLQADSMLYHIRTISKSAVFKSDEYPECAYKRRLHYHWALELQTSGDAHIHIVVSIYNDIEELAKLIDLIHTMRNKHLHPKITRRDRKYEYEVLPLGRTHFGLSNHLKKKLLKHYSDRGIQYKMMKDKEDESRENYFFPSLSPKINIYSGTGTLLEFSSIEDMAQRYDRLRKYIIHMTKIKFQLRTFQASISDAQRIHNIKGKFEDESRAVEDIAVFGYLGLKLHSSSHMLFPKSLYQRIRTQLIAFNVQYKYLSNVTIDWCKGKLKIAGSNYNKTIYYQNKTIAVERKPKQKIKIDVGENNNPYLQAKQGE